MNKVIIYVGNFDFSEKIAAGNRVLGISYALRDIGYKVILVGCDTKTSKDEKTINTKQFVDEFEAYMLPYAKSAKEWLKYKKQYYRFTDFISDLQIEDRIYAIITYGSPSLALWGNKVLNWAHKRKIKYYADVVDFLPASRGNLIFRVVKYLNNKYWTDYLNFKSDGIIAVSKYIKKYYESKNLNITIVPPTTDTTKIEFESDIEKAGGEVKLIYVGTPFALDNKKISKGHYKDRLDIAIKLLSLARQKKQNFTFSIYGITKEEYLNVIPEDRSMLDEAADYIIFKGKIPNVIARRKIHEADFTLLIRDINIMTTAGFPTKFSESISCGTPVITTRTSDIEDYMTEGKNGFFLSMLNYKIQAEELIEIVKKPRDLILEMKEYCYNSKLFDYRNYNIKLGEFLDKI